MLLRIARFLKIFEKYPRLSDSVLLENKMRWLPASVRNTQSADLSAQISTNTELNIYQLFLKTVYLSKTNWAQYWFRQTTKPNFLRWSQCQVITCSKDCFTAALTPRPLQLFLWWVSHLQCLLRLVFVVALDGEVPKQSHASKGL